MSIFIEALKDRNQSLFWFAIINLGMAALFFILAKKTSTQVAGINAWYKPFKFALSIGVYVATMAWYCYYLPSFNIRLFNWANIFLFSFEIIYITIQAARGQESHFNLATPFYRLMFGGMAIAAIAITVYAAYVGKVFLQTDFPNLPDYYIWAIRLSIIIFVIFSFQGLMMGGRQTHSIGKEVQNTFLPVFKWNMKEGDLRVAHFIGIHALQILPLLSFYVFKTKKAVFALSGFYLLFAVFVLVQALQAKPFIKSK
ncbi:hypothetical protein [Asinibacterium sp. OR53]|uniref:hypothetical protein n=1 Tax=Asinibacterium sp. OR53 TaxID=925409 RepID=UPI00047B249E|nr:hypothetical protein [Asinibacterium sp. OR53]